MASANRDHGHGLRLEDVVADANPDGDYRED
jgi:hypothetical protein